MRDYMQAITNLAQFSKNANIFILIHKLDKIPETERSKVFEQRKQELLQVSQGMNVKEVFGTSIWDESLYKAWSQIVQLLIPNLAEFKESLRQLSQICDCDEIVIFEKSTFLVIAYHENKPQKDILKYERLSNIIKQFKLSCRKLGTEIKSLSVRNSRFTAMIKEFTQNTYIMMVVSDPKIRKTHMHRSLVH
jgi:Ras-related GTP-binding protein A/B